MKLAADEFLRRFLQHTLPTGYQRIRHYGLFANRHRKKALLQCRQLLSTAVSELLPHPKQDYRELYEALTAVSLRLCPHCHQGIMEVIETLPPRRFQPPATVDSS